MLRFGVGGTKRGAGTMRGLGFRDGGGGCGSGVPGMLRGGSVDLD